MPNITLTWSETNSSEAGYNVYRSDAPMNPASLPTPLAQLAANAVSYVDSTVVADATYYYRVAAVRGAELAVSGEIIAVASAVTLTTKSLLHFDAVDGSTFIADAAGRTWTAYGNAQIDTAQSKFGGSSLLLDGDDYISSAHSDDFILGAGDFTVECFIRLSSLPSSANFYFIVCKDDIALTRGWSMVVSGPLGGKLRFNIWSGSTSYPVGSLSALTALIWVHVAVARQGNTLRSFVDGVLQESLDVTGISTNDTTHPIILGIVPSNGVPQPTTGFAGHIEEFRLVKGEAKYTSNFTPPAAPFTMS